MDKIIFKNNQYTKKSSEELFWEKVDKRSEDECWEWIASRDSCNYGMFYPKDHSNGVKASRYSYQLRYGDIPKGLYVLHKCDNPPCVNPKHLFIGTQTDNMQDMISKGRLYDRRGEKNSKVKLTEEDVRTVKLLRKNGMTYKSIAKSLKVSEGCINHILNGRHWVGVE
jgi:hypothetical protein